MLLVHSSRIPNTGRNCKTPSDSSCFARCVMYRLDAMDADALRFEVSAAPSPKNEVHSANNLSAIGSETSTIPKSPSISLDLGIVNSCEIIPHEHGNSICVRLTLTAPGCGRSSVLKAEVESKLSCLPDVADVCAEVIFGPPWNTSRISAVAQRS